MKRLRKLLWLFRTNIIVVPTTDFPKHVNLRNIDVFYKETDTSVTIEMNSKLERFNFSTKKKADNFIAKLIREI